MELDELITAAFAEHEHLAPEPAEILRELPARRRHRTRRRWAVVGAVAAVTLLVGALATVAGRSGSRRPAAGSAPTQVAASDEIVRSGVLIPAGQRRRAGPFSVSGLDGGTVSLAQQAGRVVVVDYWATWCGPCTSEMPQLDTIYRALSSRGLSVVGVDTKDVAADARAFVTANRISFPIGADEDATSARAFGDIPVDALPVMVLVDRSGRVAGVYLGAADPAGLTPVLDRLLAES